MTKSALRPLIVREAKRRLKECRVQNSRNNTTVYGFSMADFISGGQFALDLLKQEKVKEPEGEA